MIVFNITRNGESMARTGQWRDLRRADLRGANLSRANIYEADLSWADLTEADLSWADLSRADLREAVMSAQQRAYAKSRGAIVD